VFNVTPEEFSRILEKPKALDIIVRAALGGEESREMFGKSILTRDVINTWKNNYCRRYSGDKEVDAQAARVSPDKKAPDAETLKAEALKAEALKAEALKAEALKAEALKAEALKAEALRAEALKAEALKKEALKAKALKAEAPDAGQRHPTKKRAWTKWIPLILPAVIAISLLIFTPEYNYQVMFYLAGIVVIHLIQLSKKTGGSQSAPSPARSKFTPVHMSLVVNLCLLGYTIYRAF
jgi:hypothetical protein